MGLRVRLLKGPGVNKLISSLSYSMYSENKNPIFKSYEDLAEPQSVHSSYTNPMFNHKSFVKDNELNDWFPSDTQYTSLLTGNGMSDKSNNSDFIEIVKPGMNPRYHLKVEPDPRNPYATILRLDITGKLS